MKYICLICCDFETFVLSLIRQLNEKNMAMMKPMTAYKTIQTKNELHSFVKTRRGEAYAFNGILKIYANRAQAEKATIKLKEVGINAFVSFDHPFLLHKL